MQVGRNGGRGSGEGGGGGGSAAALTCEAPGREGLGFSPPGGRGERREDCGETELGRVGFAVSGETRRVCALMAYS